MTVTKVERQKNNEKRYSVYIDGEFAFGMSGEDILYFKLTEGKELDEERYRYIMEYVLYVKAREQAYSYLGYKSRTEKELRQKLTNSGYPEDITEKVVELMKKYNYLNDEIYAKSHIKDRIKFKPSGKRLLKYELSQKGISEEIVQKAVEETDIDELEMAVSILEKKSKGKNLSDRKQKEKLYMYLIRKGFDYETTNKAFRRIMENTEDIEDI